MTKVDLVVENKTGIHARPASVFVQTAAKFKSKIQITANGKTVDAKGILGIMSMGLKKGTAITISADGADEADDTNSGLSTEKKADDEDFDLFGDL